MKTFHQKSRQRSTHAVTALISQTTGIHADKDKGKEKDKEKGKEKNKDDGKEKKQTQTQHKEKDKQKQKQKDNVHTLNCNECFSVIWDCLQRLQRRQ